MDKLKMTTADKVDVNIEKIEILFPNCVTERVDESGNVEKAIDFDMLKQELSHVLVDGAQERYQFTWPDKKKSILLANAPINKTLRPVVRDEQVPTGADTSGRSYMSSGSVGRNGEAGKFDSENLYIEGDNLDVLKLLQETYLGKVKMIYIDPPYNTRKDLIYKDNYDIELEPYLNMSSQIDEEGNRLFQNKETNGRFHTDWLNMIYPRIKLARDLLKEDGIIFISIDDNEVNNMIKICNEVFSESNFVAQMIVDGTPKNDPNIISTAHEYCLVYVKNYETAKECNWGIRNPIYAKLVEIIRNAKSFEIAQQNVKKFYHDNNLEDENIANYKYVDAHGLYRIGPIDDPQGGGARDVRYNPETKEELKTPNSGWRCSIETWNKWVKNGEILFPIDNAKLCSRKVYIDKDKLDLVRGYFKIQTRKDTDLLKDIFGMKVFQFPKPLELIKTFIDSSTTEDHEIVMDYFSGSATLAHAVMQLNAERENIHEQKNVRYILVQLRENLDDNLKSAQGNREKQTIKNAIEFCKTNNISPHITEIAKERIRRAGKKILENAQNAIKDTKQGDMFGEQKQQSSISSTLDIGFRVLKLDTSNMKDVYYRAENYSQSLLDTLEGNIKADRTPQDLLLQVMLDMGVMLSSKIEERKFAMQNGQCVMVNAQGATIDEQSCSNLTTIYIVGDYSANIQPNLIACFDDNLSNEVVTAIAKMKPLYAVFRDSSFANDSVATNFEQIFSTYSPTTTRKVL